MVATQLGLLVLLTLAAPEQGATPEVARFQLFGNCEPMYVLVEDLGPDARNVGLTGERLRFAAESRLRGARLYQGEPGAPYLYVRVNIVGPAFSVDLQYNKWLFDPASGLGGVAPTWRRGVTGTHGRTAEYIVSALSGLLDQFLTEYLRVNERVCGN